MIQLYTGSWARKACCRDPRPQSFYFDSFRQEGRQAVGLFPVFLPILSLWILPDPPVQVSKPAKSLGHWVKLTTWQHYSRPIRKFYACMMGFSIGFEMRLSGWISTKRFIAPSLGEWFKDVAGGGLSPRLLFFPGIKHSRWVYILYFHILILMNTSPKPSNKNVCQFHHYSFIAIVNTFEQI